MEKTQSRLQTAQGGENRSSMKIPSSHKERPSSSLGPGTQ